MSIRKSAYAICLALAMIAASCSDDDTNGSAENADPTVVSEEAAELPVAEEPSAGEPASEEEPAVGSDLTEPVDGPEFIELTYWEALERGTASLEGGDDRCVDVDEQTRRCEVDLSFDSIATHLGRAHDESIMEQTTYATACPESGDPGVAIVLRGGITSQWGDELFFKARTGSCPVGPDYWIVTGGTGRFEGASGTMSNTTTDHPSFSGFGTGQLSVRAELWEDWLPPASETPPDPDIEYLDIPYFEGVLSAEPTNQADDECDRSDPEVVVCTTAGTAQLRGTLIGEASEASSGTSTQLLAETCELDDGTTGVPNRLDSTGTITTQLGDEIFFTARTRIDPCATLGSGTAGVTPYWRVTGGTGRFEDAHGLMSGVATPDLGFLLINTGTLSVRADRWPQLAEEYAQLPSGEDYIELRYFERFLTGIEFDLQPTEECDTTDPALEVCTYTLGGNLTGTHIGAASEIQSGTITRYLEETCATGGFRSVRLGVGVITSPWGDELDFRNPTDSCDIQYWVFEGGTGRFAGGGGVMTGLGAFEFGDDTNVLQIGSFRLRAELWDDLIPEPD
jgi:hypothetical protein